MNNVLVTGAAGFVGAFLCKRLLEETDARIIGFDNMSDYYDVGGESIELGALFR
jgi:nucleoside-diphosphate-sugar epimerase